jgi:glycosyltransferase involved in cell wall biosynthesis
MTQDDVQRVRDDLRVRRKQIHDEFTSGWSQIWRAYKRGRHAPTLPVNPAKGATPPKVGIITVTRGRAEWWANMVQNVTKQSWPISRMEWIIVDDGTAAESLSAMVDDLCKKLPALSVRYVELPEPLSIGAKRNAAVEAAAADVEVFVCMDDDDHYPADSIASRISWLEPTRKGTHIAYCSTLPMYDTRRYISAVNVPPLTESPAERVSEATMAFTREAWVSRPFPDASMAEGYEFMRGREGQTVEIPPQGVIVSFIHRDNTSSRRIPADQEPNGCHYGFTDGYFQWLSRVGGATATPVGGR